MNARLQAWLQTPAGNNFGHIAEGLLLMLPFILLGYPIVGWIAQSFYWLGRERRDHEIDAKLNAADWYRGWNVFAWSVDGQRDLFVPVVFNGLVAAVVYNVQRAW